MDLILARRYNHVGFNTIDATEEGESRIPTPDSL